MDDDIKILYGREKKRGAVLKVIGVGGAGGNAINRMIEEDLKGVEFIAVNTDMQVLSTIQSPALKLQIGDKITKGLGAGSNPDIGEQAALDDTGSIIEVLEGAHMVFVTAGMGGGTGTGASHVIANHASSMGILTVAVVSKPFLFEKEKRMRVAEDGIRKLRENVDAIIIIPNQKLLELGDPNITYKNAYKKADEVLLQAVRGISDIINSTGAQNVDFADVKATMVGRGITLMGTGEAKGENRAEEATKRALNSPLLDNLAINGATGILFNITASSTLTLAEIEKISDLITRNADADATIKFGVIEDENVGDTLRITVIATGFKEARSETQARGKTPPASFISPEPSYRQPTPAQPFLIQSRPGSSVDVGKYVNEGTMPNMTHGPENFDDPLDVPTFQRLNPIRKK
ncbi:MAG: cell division protein FtsZ [Candidatus Aminicenantes bacterium]|nr:cell division protein FtsZ [Candidatus Aminicenantes bacterium]